MLRAGESHFLTRNNAVGIPADLLGTGSYNVNKGSTVVAAPIYGPLALAALLVPFLVFGISLRVTQRHGGHSKVYPFFNNRISFFVASLSGSTEYFIIHFTRQLSLHILTGRHIDVYFHLLLSPQWPHSLRNFRLILEDGLDLLHDPLVDFVHNIQREKLLFQLLCIRAPKNNGTGLRHLRDVRERELYDAGVELRLGECRQFAHFLDVREPLRPLEP
jgi:hypothetical protein